MSPPLMSELMRGDEVSQIDIVLVDNASDEADTFGVRNGVGKGLGEIPVARELHDAVLRELVRAVMRLVIVETGPRGGQHIVEAVSVGRVVVDLEVDRAAGTRVDLLALGVAGGEIGEEVEDVRAPHAVLVEVAAVLLPLALEIAWGNGHLIAGRADHGVISKPVGAGGEDVEPGVDRFSAGGHLFQRSQALLAAAAGIVQLEAL